MARKSKKETNEKPLEQYEHKDKQRLNNPPVGLVDAHTDNGGQKKKQYQFDPHLDPQLEWAGKAEHTSFEVPTVSLHVHERIDPRRIIESVKKQEAERPVQMSLFEESRKPLREAIEFYKHKENWSNRLIAGDSLLVMNSLLEKEGMGGKVQMVYFDPPYGIKYGSNFQPFVNKRDVKDGKDEDLTAEPEMIKAFRDTWELGIHSYLTYLRDRLLLVRELLSDSGSVFVQISDENVHHVREIMDEVFGAGNFVSQITFRKGMPLGSITLANDSNYVIWYAMDLANIKYRQLYISRIQGTDTHYNMVELPDGLRIKMEKDEFTGVTPLPKNSKVFTLAPLISSGRTESCVFKFDYEGQTYFPQSNRSWKTNFDGMTKLSKYRRLFSTGERLMYILYFDDYPVTKLTCNWSDTLGAMDKVYVVQTASKIIERCLLMTTDPGDLAIDITCGSGTTAFVAEKWGRRWITCDTSRVAIALAKQRLMTANFDYYELAHPDEGVGSGFKYKTVPHITLKSIANNEPAPQETLYDQPFIDHKKQRVTGPFTVEAVPAPTVKMSESEFLVAENKQDFIADTSVIRSGETLRQNEWIDELKRSGVRGKSGNRIEFTRVETTKGLRYVQAEAETKEDTPKKVYVVFGPEHAPLEQRMVELAWEEVKPYKPDMLLFCALQFDEEAAKDIDEMKPEITSDSDQK
ncbi:MAG: site-specific DNA-methyltransferase [Desulfobacterales bacterium]|nr:site-specific DNA-methyltransferase [Desulfobacterales bacterium]